MSPPRGILPRSVRERYHRTRAERAAEAAPPEPAERSAPPALSEAASPSVAPPAAQSEPVEQSEAPSEPQSVAPPAPEPAPQTTGSQRHLGRRAIGTAGLVGAILAVGAVGIVVGSVVSTTGDTDTAATTAAAPARTAAKLPTAAPPPTAPATSTPVVRATAKRIPLTAGGSYDPLGDGSEHGDLVSLATDGNPSTAWSSEDYQALNKAGVGLYVDPNHAVSPTRLTIITPTPGFAASVYGARGATAPKGLGGWTKLATVKNVKRVKAVKLDAAGRRYTHVLLWITSLPPTGGAVEVSELSLR